MIVLGVDPGLSTGLAVLSLEGDDRAVRWAASCHLTKAPELLRSTLKTWEPRLVAIEGWELMGAARMRGACEQAWAAGVLTGHLREMGVEPVVLTRSLVKRALNCRRHADKQGVRAALSTLVLGMRWLTTDHESDAAATALAAWVRRPVVHA